MKYTPQEIMQYTAEEDVKFIRLAFCDVYGKQKNISIMPSDLTEAKLLAAQSDFVKDHLPQRLIDIYCK